MGKELIEIQFDEAQLKRVRRAVASIRNGFAKVAQGAITKTLTRVKSLTVRTLARDAGIKQKSLRRDITVKRPSFKVLAGFVRFGAGRVPIWEMFARQGAKGVAFRGRGGPQLIPGAFVATMRSGHVGVWKRTGKGRAIRELFGPSFWFLWETHPESREAVTKEAAGILNVELERRMDYLLLGGARG